MVKAKEIILIGGSAGAYELIVEILTALPSSFKPAIIVILHRNERFSTKIEETLSLKLDRTIHQASDKGEISAGNVYFAPPGYHLLIEPNYLFSLDVSERIQFSRPSIDVLFETAAEVYENRCTAFLLSGANKDGSDGLHRIHALGGKSIVQLPQDARISFMPSHAIQSNEDFEIFNDIQIITFFKNLK
ncbi:chemotaxis protein CheB [Sphingobacterium shayense]|uniref:chemotaxis protein CheB n=1 Tax=Sphingobacterium shayense TaxID=626343 RepID=UPI0015545382|nr:chemotaxis protein CheB [Sphingobacterium shayense]NQD69169.1 chemotaxis protein CheB [Sphingobacterium shayense]